MSDKLPSVCCFKCVINCIWHDIFNNTTLDQYNPFGTLLGLPRSIYLEVSIKSLGVILIVWWCLTPLSTIFQLYQWRSVLLVEEAGENHRPVTSNWQTCSQNVVHLALIEIRTHNSSGDRHRLHRYSCKSNYHTITDMTAPQVGGYIEVSGRLSCAINRCVPLMSSSSSSGTVNASGVVECKCASPSEI